MSSSAKAPPATRPLWLKALLTWFGLVAFAIVMPLLSGLHAHLLKPIQPLRQKINFNEAVKHSLSGQAVIVDLRPAEIRRQKPVPGSVILLPKKPDSPEWDTVAPLLESLKGTPVYIIFPHQDDHPARFKLMSYKLDLWAIDMTP